MSEEKMNVAEKLERYKMAQMTNELLAKSVLIYLKDSDFKWFDIRDELKLLVNILEKTKEDVDYTFKEYQREFEEEGEQDL